MFENPAHEKFMKRMGFEVLSQLSSTGGLYHVRRGNDEGVFRIGFEYTYRSYIHHPIREYAVLKAVEGTEGIPRIIDFFKNKNWFPRKVILGLFKEYIPGRTLSTGHKIIDEASKTVLRKAVDRIHDEGFV